MSFILKYTLIFILLILVSGMQVQAGTLDDNGLQQVRFIPHWVPQAQFAGYYVAKDKGFYARRGLDVEILRGGPDSPASEFLAQGRADFASMFLINGLILRSQGVPVVNVGQMVQRSALMLVAKKDSGIHSPIDLQGRKISVWPEFAAQPLAFFSRYHLNVTTVHQGYTLNLLLMDGVDAATAMWYNEYYALINSGINANELTTFFLADYGLNFPEDGLYCHESLVRNEPDLVRNFVQASIEGWEYAFNNPEQALDMVMERVNQANLPTNRVHQRWMLDRMKDIIQPAGSDRPAGWLDERDYELVAAELFENEVITHIAPFRKFYVPDFSSP
ncbi:ABC transporter substrate-binding protein [Desulfonatronovibrio hydrogenovorans]|uniref:ABC transporter substrate-binding protein n=1 Tax=Desulfonatronovibrio hydrogenovorans TaxID=53245 RepID=UPI00055925B1|nr:ABC transporter substrate-binding protein [Desulfonatronovibrio hydrogenovorans]